MKQEAEQRVGRNVGVMNLLLVGLDADDDGAYEQ
jgi:hypothetical protein